MIPGFLNIPWFAWGALALVIAGVFAVFVPGADRVQAATGTRFIIARWFHSLVWLLLALSCFMRGIGNPALSGLADPLAAAGGVCYVIFLITLMTLRTRDRDRA